MAPVTLVQHLAIVVLAWPGVLVVFLEVVSASDGVALLASEARLVRFVGAWANVVGPDLVVFTAFGELAALVLETRSLELVCAGPDGIVVFSVRLSAGLVELDASFWVNKAD